ncbi:unnamed protein product [Vicia faba]|nr:unnamed protein product [Vicia faba]
MTTRLGRIIGSIISSNQATFVPSQQIHSHIMLAYELIKGYTRKGGTPRCMIQLDMQELYDMVDWKALESFMQEVGSHLNPYKSRIYFGVVDGENKKDIMCLIGFKEGYLPFKYLGVSLTSKKLNACHYMILVEKIINCTKHWSTKLLSYTGRLHLIRSISFAVTNYWLICFPLPKSVIRKIYSIYCSFLWMGKNVISRKGLVSWKHVCRPVKQGGLRIIDLSTWNTCTMLKLMWNICNKDESLWIKWVHTYYLKGKNVLDMLEKVAVHG